MNSEKQKSSPNNTDELSLVDIYLVVKRNRKLFFIVVLLSIFISMVVAYNAKETLSGNLKIKNEYTLWIEIGQINDTNNWLDNPKNTLEKIKNIYIPKVINEFSHVTVNKLHQSAISVLNSKGTGLITLRIIRTSNDIDYKKILSTIASHVIEDHNVGLKIDNEYVYKVRPTRIIEGPTLKNIEIKNKEVMFIPILGFILGIFAAFFAVFMKEFFSKVREAEAQN